MKLRTLGLAVMIMALLFVTLIPETQATVVVEESDYCELADDTCRGLQQDVVEHCQANAGGDCFCKGVKAFNSCMQQFGCNGYSQQYMIEMGCGPD